MIDFLRRWLIHNLGIKVVSLILAVALWTVVARSPIAEVAVQVPIEFHNFPPNLEISSEHIPQAEIRVRGAERIVRRLVPLDIRTEIDLSHVGMGEHTFDLGAEQVRRPSGLDVVQVVPSQFHLTFDTRLVKQIEVRPRVVGSFARGYAMESVAASPKTITISGPRRRVEAVEAAVTDPVDASGNLGREVFETHAYISDPLVQVLNPEPIRVMVVMKKDSASGGGR